MAKDKINKSTKAKTRTRNYATVVYPESAPKDWDKILESQCVPAFISPKHDKDVNPNGEHKKDHYHVMIMYDSVKTIEQAEELFSKIGGVGCEVIQSTRGYGRYLCHMDNPEKVQYKQEDVRSLCGADYVGIIGLATDKYKAIGEMIDFCQEYTIYSYSQLLEYCRKERMDWFRVLCDSGTMVMMEYLKSKKWTDDGQH